MRLAISGTHCSGKSTLVEAFLLAHSQYIHEPEPYEQMQESFSSEPSAEDFLHQLEYHRERLQNYQPGDHVIFERCAVDFVAYLQALIELRRDTADVSVFEQAVDLAREAISLVDIIALLPANESEIYVPAEEDPKLRATVDRNLERFLMDDELEILTAGKPVVLELSGTTNQRLQMLEQAIPTQRL